MNKFKLGEEVFAVVEARGKQQLTIPCKDCKKPCYACGGKDHVCHTCKGTKNVVVSIPVFEIIPMTINKIRIKLFYRGSKEAQIVRYDTKEVYKMDKGNALEPWVFKTIKEANYGVVERTQKEIMKWS